MMSRPVPLFMNLMCDVLHCGKFLPLVKSKFLRRSIGMGARLVITRQKIRL